MKHLFFLFSVFLFFIFLGSLSSAIPVEAEAVDCPPHYSDTTRSGVCLPQETGLSQGNVLGFLGTFLKWILGILSVLGVLAFVISGIQYLTAAGDEDQAKTAKRNIQYTVIGITVALSGLIIITAIDRIFQGRPDF